MGDLVFPSTVTSASRFKPKKMGGFHATFEVSLALECSSPDTLSDAPNEALTPECPQTLFPCYPMMR
jgi:hypothetical protein